MSSLCETIRVVVPSFATVTLIPAPGFNVAGTSETPGSPSVTVKSKTLRVPITSSMTVRQLAKGAMMRYMLSLRRAAKEQDDVVRHLCRTGIVVTEVYLSLSSDAARPNVVAVNETESGCTTGELPAQKIELLSDDYVVQVVQVMKETVHMRFRAASAAAVKKSSTSSKQGAATAEAQSTDEDLVTEADLVTATKAEETSNSMSIDAPPAAVALGGSAFEDPAVSGRDRAIENAVASTSVAGTVSGAAQESSRTPVLARQHSETTACNVDATEDSSWEEDEKAKEEQHNISLSIATLREREAQRIRWGPEAHKHFAANYVSSPEKIMVGRFKCGGRPPPVVQLHSAQTSSSASSMGSICAIQSPRSLMDSTDVAESGHDRLSPRPVGAPKTDSDEELHEHQPSPQTSRKRHHCDNSFSPQSTSSSIQRTPEALTSSATTESRRFQVATAPAVSTARNTYSAAEEVTGGRQPVSPNREGQDALLCSAVTPVDVAMRAGTPLSVPSTVAKPVVAVVARQLSFEEDGDIALKRSRAVSNPSATTSACSVCRVIQE